MFGNYLTVAIRHLLQNRLYTFISMFGLAVGLAASILMLLFAQDELSYDKHWQNADRIYRITVTTTLPGKTGQSSTRLSGGIGEPLFEYLKEDIEYFTRFDHINPFFSIGDAIHNEYIRRTDKASADMFDFEVISGDIHKALSDNSGIALSETLARKYFGDEDPIGKVIGLTFLAANRDFQVRAVYRDLPDNTVLRLPALITINEADSPWRFGWLDDSFYLYVQLKPGADITRIEPQFNDFIDNMMPLPSDFGADVKPSELISLSAQPLTEIHLKSDVSGREMKPAGNMQSLAITLAITSLVLLIACINFTNLSTARSTQRAREVALRKVLGASRRQLIIQFIGESILLALLASFVGLVIAELVLPLLNNFSGKQLGLDYTDLSAAGVLVLLAIAVGILGGIYPAVVLSGYKPSAILKANQSSDSRQSVTFRNLLVVVQFTIAVVLMVVTVVIYGQTQYALNMDTGYERENKIVVQHTGRKGVREKRDLLKQRMLSLPEVASVTYSIVTPSSKKGYNSDFFVKHPDENAQQPMYAVGRNIIGYDFFRTFGIQLLAGRGYSPQYAMDGLPEWNKAVGNNGIVGSIVVNESLSKFLGYTQPQDAVGEIVKIPIGEIPGSVVFGDIEIIGVTPDVKFHSVRNMVRPEAYIFIRSKDAPLIDMTIHFTGSRKRATRQVENIWRELFPEIPFVQKHLNQLVEAEYEQEMRISTIMTTLAVLAVILACLGLFGLATFSAERRVKEIGIRKVLGANTSDIVRLLVWQFSKPVLLANLIAWPIALWTMSRWLQNYPYRLDDWLLLPICLVASLAALAIAWGTIIGNALRVAKAAPVKALRCE